MRRYGHDRILREGKLELENYGKLPLSARLRIRLRENSMGKRTPVPALCMTAVMLLLLFLMDHM